MSINLDAIKARLAAATPGPWRVSRQNIDERPGTSEVCDLVNDCWVIVEHNDLGRYEDDADLIAHAPADIAALLAEVERLRGHRESCTDNLRKGYETGKAEERAAVVAWLNGCATEGFILLRINEACDAEKWALAIERGEHRREGDE
jgi:hypothetical protein